MAATTAPPPATPPASTPAQSGGPGGNKPGDGVDPQWFSPKLLVDFLGIASVAILIQFVGGAILWLRFSQAGLPATPAVAAQPDIDLLILGLRSLVVPIFAGLLAFVAQYLLLELPDTTNCPGEPPSHIRVPLVILGGIAGAGLLITKLVSDSLSDLQFWVMLAGVTPAVLAVLYAAARAATTRRALCYLFFFGALFWGVIYNLVREVDRHPRLDLAVAVRSEGQGAAAQRYAIGGFLVARDEHDTWIARFPDAKDEHLLQVDQLPTKQLVRFDVGPTRRVSVLEQATADRLAAQALAREDEIVPNGTSVAPLPSPELRIRIARQRGLLMITGRALDGVTGNVLLTSRPANGGRQQPARKVAIRDGAFHTRLRLRRLGHGRATIKVTFSGDDGHGRESLTRNIGVG